MFTLKQSIATMICCLASLSAFAMEAIETSSVVVPLAEGWRERSGSQPIAADGPNLELMQISVVRVGLTDSLDAAEEVAATTLASASVGMKIIMPSKSSVLSNGTRMKEFIAQTVDGHHVLLGVILRGASAIVLATIEGPSASALALANARTQLLSLRWK